jgi:tetratricopeptide (TPR) repeat protein
MAKHLKRGAALLAVKDYPRAALEFKNAARVMPKDAEPYYQLGLVYLATGDLQNAYQSLRHATELNPSHSAAQLKIAEILSLSRNKDLVQEAVSRLTGTFGASPNDLEAIGALALAEWQLGQRDDASKRLEEALERFPKDLRSSVTLARMKLATKDFAGAEEVLKKAADGAPESSMAAVALGRLYMVLRHLDKAESLFKRAIQLDAKSGPALISLAHIQFAAKRLDEAEQSYKRLATFPDKAYKPLYATFLYQTGKREAAVAEFESLAKADPSDREIRTRLAAAYVGLGRSSDAENVLAAALKRNPKDTDALLQRAELRIRSGKVDDAERDLKEVIHFTPDSSLAHFLLATAYQAKGLMGNQQQELQETLRLNPAMLPARLALAARYLSVNQAQAALETMDAAPAEHKALLKWTIGRNWALLTLGKLQEAKVGVEIALQQGRPPEALHQNAVLKFVQRDYAGARADVDELLKGGTADVRLAQLLVETYAAQKDLGKGVNRLKEVAAAHSKSAPMQHLLGVWCLRAGDSAGAQQAFANAKAADPRFVAADMALAELDMREGRNDAARQKLRGVVAADPRNIRALLLSAWVEQSAGNRDAVIATYRAVLNLDQSNLIALNNLAYTLAPENADEALKFAQQALEIAPDSPDVQDTLGWVYYRKGLYSMAVRHLKTAVDKEATPRRQFHLGMSYVKVGDQANGQRIVAEALRKDPNLAKTEQGW